MSLVGIRLMHHDIQKIISYQNFYLFFPIYMWKEFKLFQLLEIFKKNVPMQHPSIKKSLVRSSTLHYTRWDKLCSYTFCSEKLNLSMMWTIFLILLIRSTWFILSRVNPILHVQWPFYLLVLRLDFVNWIFIKMFGGEVSNYLG